jgi:MoxR-like ATPase
MFYPTYVSGLSGNGKTFMIEQACAKLGKEFIRVQINPETDEDDLLGGFRLIDGETVFAKGPVLKAMENGAILLLDEIDRATNKIMCLQGILEGKPVLVKKTGETISPKKGFNVFATANTKGKGSDDGRFTAASIIDEAFLERFTISVDQQFPSAAIEKKILSKHMDKFDIQDDEFVQKLVTWADIIRKTFYDDGVDEVISTRRLCHVVQTFSIFKDKVKSIDLCISRFDEDTKLAFLDLYTKVDSGAQLDYGQPEPETFKEELVL